MRWRVQVKAQRHPRRAVKASLPDYKLSARVFPISAVRPSIRKKEIPRQLPHGGGMAVGDVGVWAGATAAAGTMGVGAMAAGAMAVGVTGAGITAGTTAGITGRSGLAVWRKPRPRSIGYR